MPRHPPFALSSLTVKFTHEQQLTSPVKLLGACTAICLVDAHTLGITIRCVRRNIHYSIVKDLFRDYLARQKTPKIQHSTSSFNTTVLSAQLRAARIITNRFARVGVSCPRPVFGCTADRKNFWMEARGFEPLTSGLQSPRSAKLSYAPKRERLVAGAGFEPATFGL